MKTLTLILCAVLVLPALTLVAKASPKVFEFPAADISKLEIKHTEGLIDLKIVETDQIKITATKVSGNEKCYTKVTKRGHNLVAKTSKPFFRLKQCRVDLLIEMPVGVAVSGDIGASDMTVTNFSANLKLNIGAGSLKGTINSEKVDLDLGAGKVEIEWPSVPEKTQIDLNVGFGTIVMNFPENTVIDPRIDKGIGSFTSSLERDPESNIKINASIGVGFIKLRVIEEEEEEEK